MHRFFNFIRGIHFFLIFLVLEILAINLFSKSSVYTNAKMINLSNTLIGGFYSGVYDVRSYFVLRDENKKLLGEITDLKNEIESYKTHIRNAEIDSILNNSNSNNYIYFTVANVNNNSINKQHNYISIDKGRTSGIEKNMALIYNNNIVGYVLDCSDNISVAISVLNRDFRTSGKDVNGKYLGSVYWEGMSKNELVLDEIPKYADVLVGDTIVTTSYSSIFPPDVYVGLIKSFELVNGTYYKAKVEPLIKLDKLRYVDVVKYKHQYERVELEQSIGSP